MADNKNKSFTVKPELKNDKRLTAVFLRMGVLDKEDIQARISSLKDLEAQAVYLKIEDAANSKD